MPCITEETKNKVVGADPFQTVVQEASALGAFNAFFVLPVVVIVYASVLVYSNTFESDTEIVVTTECAPFDFTCTTKWGCEIAALGKRTTSKFSKGSRSLFLEQGGSATESICPGLGEALDIAPRASVKVGSILSSFEHDGFGYFGGKNGTVTQVNLTTMRLVNQSKVCDKRLLCAFASGGYGYFGHSHGIAKIDLNTLAVVKKSVAVGIGLGLGTGFAYKGYGYFGGGGNVYQVDLTTMDLINKKTISTTPGLYASVLGTDDDENPNGYGYFGGQDKFIYQVNLTTLNVTVSTPVNEVLLSVCCGGHCWGTKSGKVIYRDEMAFKDNLWHGPIGALTSTFAGTGPPAHVVEYGVSTSDLALNGVDEIWTGFQTGGNVYFGSNNGYIVMIETDPELKYPTMGASIGTIHQSMPLDFPPAGMSKYFSLFSTITTYSSNGSETIDYLYQSKHVDDFHDKPSKIIEPDYLCRRINLAPTQLHITKNRRNTFLVIMTLCMSVASAVFSGLKLFTSHAPGMYAKMKSKCERRQRTESAVELSSPEYTQM
jgi:hypothetical protein